VRKDLAAEDYYEGKSARLACDRALSEQASTWQ